MDRQPVAHAGRYRTNVAYTPAIYAMKRAEWDVAKNTLPRDLLGVSERFIARESVARSGLTLPPVPEDEKLKTVHDVMRVVRCCEGRALEVRLQKVVYGFVSGERKEISYGASGERPSPSAPADPAVSPLASQSPSPSPPTTAPARAAPPAVPPSGGGCAGCTVGASSDAVGSTALAAAGLLLLLTARRARASRACGAT